MTKKRNKQAGFIISAELMLIATILVIGLIVGWVAVRDALTAELHDVAEGLGSVNQSFTYPGVQDPVTLADVEGSSYGDLLDVSAGDAAPILYNLAPTAEAAP